MHEMAIASSIIDIVERELDKAGSGIIKEVELEIGKLAGVEYDALVFALRVTAPGSVMEACDIVIKRPDGIMRCSDCSNEFITENLFNTCPECGSSACMVYKGKELRVKSLLIE